MYIYIFLISNKRSPNCEIGKRLKRVHTSLGERKDNHCCLDNDDARSDSGVGVVEAVEGTLLLRNTLDTLRAEDAVGVVGIPDTQAVAVPMGTPVAVVDDDDDMVIRTLI